MRGLLPEAFTGFVSKINEIHNHGTRSSADLLVTPMTKTVLYGSKSIKTACSHDWNEAKNTYKLNISSLSRNQAKKLLKESILKNY